MKRARSASPPTFYLVAEFFAGIGLMRLGLEQGGFKVAWANDIEPTKADMYRDHFRGDDHFVLGDVRGVCAADLPAGIALATASFPCTDLSLAGDRGGLSGGESSMFWEFHRVLAEMDKAGRLPPVTLLENVIGFATSNGGADLEAAVAALNSLGYVCDLLVLDARWWVPQSRPRLFIVGSLRPDDEDAGWESSRLRPAWLGKFVGHRPHLKVAARRLPEPPQGAPRFSAEVERIHHRDQQWWEAPRVTAFVGSLSPIQRQRLNELQFGRRLDWRTAYRRTRNGTAVWEIRHDEVAGCLRTARGGSSRQAVVEAGRGNVRVRWMTPREYARLQGAPDYALGGVRENAARFGFGDAVCVPVIAWLAEHYLRPLLAAEQTVRYRARGNGEEGHCP